MPDPMTPAEARRHELYQDIADSAARQLVEEHHLPEEQAAEMGLFLADWLCDHLKGQLVYFNADMARKLTDRDAQIYEEMGRGKAADIAVKHGISMVRVYQIYRRVLRERRARLQPGLFEAAAATNDPVARAAGGTAAPTIAA